MNDISVRTKTFTVFAFLSLLFAGISVLGINRLSVVNDSSTEIATFWMPRVVQVNTMNDTVSNFRILQEHAHPRHQRAGHGRGGEEDGRSGIRHRHRPPGL
ncbi:MAG: hypothetical protein NVV74_09240 [Magnetospirillum sp.]|nr:hypothetical protein [Magnetospirillum sp.]